jgi:hypothetical protein
MWMLMIGLGWAAEPEAAQAEEVEAKAPLLRVGLGAGVGGSLKAARFRMEVVSSLPIPVGSLRFIVADRLILEPSFRHFQTLEQGVENDAREDLEDELVFSETAWGLAIKPVLFRKDANVLYPYLAYGREVTSIQGQDLVDGEEELQAYSDVDLVHAGHLGFGIQHWLDESWTLSVDASLVNLGWYLHTQSNERNEWIEASTGTYLAFYPSARMMLHLYW